MTAAIRDEDNPFQAAITTIDVPHFDVASLPLDNTTKSADIMLLNLNILASRTVIL